MKKVLTLGVIVMSSLALVACGNNNKADKDSSSVESISKKIDSGDDNISNDDQQIYATKNKIVNPDKGTMEILGFKQLSYKGKPAFAVEWKFTNTSKKQLTADDIDEATHTYFQKNGNSEQSISSEDVYILSADQADYDSVDDDDDDAYNQAIANYNAWGTESDRSSEDKIEPGKSINLLGGELIVPVSKEDVKVQIGNHDESDTDVNIRKDNFTIKYSDLTAKPFTSDLVSTLQQAVSEASQD
ncbi:hypothetical protein [Pediococcus acidilactici]|uniref:hypothetical protein n=1 Tax=Pediococcus acidilactici TaxID=1254 RepID=UPI0025A4D4E6|nr:hypothetical protein [Pediococcus acidilactici]MDM5041906.1 hypothetical protein [Pediococcus acidilactici]